MSCRKETIKTQSLMLAIALVLQIAWTHASLEEALVTLNNLRRNALANQDFVPLCAYPEGVTKATQGVRLYPYFQHDDTLSKEILNFHQIFTNAQVTPTFNRQIEITRSDQTTGKYKLGEKIADGSHGSVWLGSSTDGTEKVVTVKQEPLTEENLKSGEMEKQLHSLMYGVIDGVSVMIDCGTLNQDGVEYRVTIYEKMDFDVSNALKLCEGKFSQRSSITLIRQLLKIVEEIHRLGIVHRNLKPEKLMLNFPTTSSPLGMRVVDFSHAQKYDLIPAKRSRDPFDRTGSAITMSTFTHNKEPPHPRDDLLSIWYMFALFDEGELPWSKLLLNLNKPDSGGNLESTMNEILKSKQDNSSKLLVGKYPELEPFIKHILDMQIGDDPDYTELDGYLKAVMKRCAGHYDWKYNWEFKGNMLFRNPNVLHISVVDIPGDSCSVHFEPFYDSLVREIEGKGRTVQVLQELDDGILFAGFGYKCIDSICLVFVTLQMNNQVWEKLSKFNLPVPYLHGIWETQRMNEIAYLKHSGALVDESRYDSRQMEMNLILPNPFSILETVCTTELFGMINRHEIAEMGFKLSTVKTWNTVDKQSEFQQEIIVEFRRSFNVEEFATHVYAIAGKNLSWSVNEISGISNSSLADANMEKISFSRNGSGEVYFITTIESSNWKCARNLAVQRFFGNEIAKDLLNVRVQWKIKNNKYNFTFIQDAFYKSFLTGVNPQEFSEGRNWLIGTHITEGDRSLRQLANTIASKMPVRHKLGFENNGRLTIVSITVDARPNDDAAVIFELMTKLRSDGTREEADLYPKSIGSVAFGYEISEKYVYGVAIFEELSHTFVKLINEMRLNKRVPELLLSDKSNSWAKSEMVEYYRKQNSIQNSEKTLRKTSENTNEPTEVGAGVSDAGGEKGKNKPRRTFSSNSFTRFLPQKRENSKSNRSFSSLSLIVGPEQVETGHFQIGLPTAKATSIQVSIEAYFKDKPPQNKALTNADYNTISIAAFTDSQSTKIAYKLYREDGLHLRQ